MQRTSWRGPAAMTAAMALFCFNDALVKAYAATLPVAQSMAIRGVIATVATLGVIIALRQTAVMSASFNSLVLWRAFAECGAVFCLIFALIRLPIGDVTAISQMAPLIALPLAAIIFRERVSILRWLLVALGFLGVWLIAKPGRAGFDPIIGLAVLTAVGFAARDILSRRISAQVPALAVALATVAVVAVLSGLVAAAMGFAPATPAQVVALGAAGLLLAIGQGLVYVAFRLGSVSEVAPYNYTKTLFGVLVGAAAFGERPDILTLAGVALVITSGAAAAIVATAPPKRT